MTDSRIVLDDDTRLLLRRLADKLADYEPEAKMCETTRVALALVFSEKLLGPTEAAYAAEQLLLAAAPPVCEGQTRRDYAALLRLVAKGVSP
ncbi:hypothetical protein OHA27_37000 [Streptomyces sp. NBC_01619]|uniref:hypothetical protein n=1 Tax=Streptomyces sp. NBC_01619 TaxID=2975901 RepID=UPI002251EAB5|nr:hypothetical protein [Streptomyces sp. NBC_01619]MCX4515763.1 hypothetical protein [Streptomyces sp. NBC_01619]